MKEFVMSKTFKIILCVYLAGFFATYFLCKSIMVSNEKELNIQYPNNKVVVWTKGDKKLTIVCSMFSWITFFPILLKSIDFGFGNEQPAKW